MHEVALARQVATMASRAADGRRVARVELEIGHLRQVVPEAMLHAWDATTRGTSLDASELAIRAIPAVVECADCGARTTLDEVMRFDCASCGSHHTSVVAGEEFTLVAIEIADGPDGPDNRG